MVDSPLNLKLSSSLNGRVMKMVSFVLFIPTVLGLFFFLMKPLNIMTSAMMVLMNCLNVVN